jgi:hypothetical protein
MTVEVSTETDSRIPASGVKTPGAAVNDEYVTRLEAELKKRK